MNFYGNQSSALEIDNIISILKEFIKEKYSYILFESQQSKINSNKDSKSDLYLRKNTENEYMSEKFNNKNKLKLNNNTNSGMNLNLDPNYQKSAKLLNFENKLSSFP